MEENQGKGKPRIVTPSYLRDHMAEIMDDVQAGTIVLVQRRKRRPAPVAVVPVELLMRLIKAEEEEEKEREWRLAY